MLKIDIRSDPVCPWCYVGKARLDAALRESRAAPHEISWKPFQLNPDMPAVGMDRGEYLRKKFGGNQGVMAAYSPLLHAAEDDGIELNLDLIRIMPNSLDAHRLIRWGEVDGPGGSVIADALFHAFFVQGKDIGSTEVLADLAERCGMHRKVTERLLKSEVDISFMKEEDVKARRTGINAVPCFIINGHLAVFGAQPASVWRQVINEIQQKTA